MAADTLQSGFFILAPFKTRFTVPYLFFLTVQYRAVGENIHVLQTAVEGLNRSGRFGKQVKHFGAVSAALK